MSPVPGGMSTTEVVERRPSACPQSIWLSACVTIGPRQTIGWSESTRKPIDMTGEAVAARRIERLAVASSSDARPPRPIMRGMARAVDVGIEESDAGALRREREREVGRDRRLADAPLAGGDRHDICDLRQWPLAGIGDECRYARDDLVSRPGLDASRREFGIERLPEGIFVSARPGNQGRCVRPGPLGPSSRTRWRRRRPATWPRFGST